MQDTYTPEVRNAVLSTIQHPNYAKLAEYLMDGLTRDEIKEKIGFDDKQIDSMIAHIATFNTTGTEVASETVATEVAKEVVSESTENKIPVDTTTSDTLNAPADNNANVMGAQTGAGLTPENTQPSADQPANEAKTEELSA